MTGETSVERTDSADVKRGAVRWVARSVVLAAVFGVALFLWLVLVFFGDLGLMGTAIVLRIDINQLFTLALLNPLQIFKMAAILSIRSNLEVLGPAGIYALRTYGSQLMLFLLAILMVWAILPLAGTYLVFKKRGVL